MLGEWEPPNYQLKSFIRNREVLWEGLCNYSTFTVEHCTGQRDWCSGLDSAVVWWPRHAETIVTWWGTSFKGLIEIIRLLGKCYEFIPICGSHWGHRFWWDHYWIILDGLLSSENIDSRAFLHSWDTSSPSHFHNINQRAEPVHIDTYI